MSAERFRCPEDERYWPCFRPRQSPLQDRSAQPLEFILPAQCDVSRDQAELHWVQRLPNLFDLLGQRTGDEECELSSAVQAAGSGRALVV